MAEFSPETPYAAQTDGGEIIGYFASLADAQKALNDATPPEAAGAMSRLFEAVRSQCRR